MGRRQHTARCGPLPTATMITTAASTPPAPPRDLAASKFLAELDSLPLHHHHRQHHHSPPAPTATTTTIATATATITMAAASRLRASLFYRAPPILAGRPQIARFSLAASRLRQSGSAIHEPPSEIPFLPRFLQPTTYIPSWSRRRQQASEPSPSSAPPAATKTGAAKRSIFRGEWNPATFFIWIFLLIGSQAIHILKIKNDSTDYMRKSEARIQLLAEVIRKLQSGERVDVEKALGTGKKMSEIDWEQGEILQAPFLCCGDRACGRRTDWIRRGSVEKVNQLWRMLTRAG